MPVRATKKCFTQHLKTMTPDNPHIPFDLDAALYQRTDWDETVAGMHRKAATSCFLPGDGRDWEALDPLSLHCDAFILAGSTVNGEESVKSLHDFVRQNLHWEWMSTHNPPLDPLVGRMEVAMIDFLQENRPSDAPAYRRDVQRLAAKSRWTVEVSLRHGFGEEARNIHVLFIEAEALAVFRGVFSAAQLAPQVVVLPRQSGRRTSRSQRLSISGPLGAVLSEGPRPPLLIAANEDTATMAGTPWPHLWTELRWGRSAFTQWPLPASWWHEPPPVGPRRVARGED